MNDLKIRIKKYDEGYLIEIRCPVYSFWSTSYKWKALINYRGSNDPFYFSSYESALNVFISELKIDIAGNSSLI